MRTMCPCHFASVVLVSCAKRPADRNSTARRTSAFLMFLSMGAQDRKREPVRATWETDDTRPLSPGTESEHSLSLTFRKVQFSACRGKEAREVCLSGDGGFLSKALLGSARHLAQERIGIGQTRGELAFQPAHAEPTNGVHTARPEPRIFAGDERCHSLLAVGDIGADETVSDTRLLLDGTAAIEQRQKGFAQL